ncbi:hypothetical protein V865_008535 [Kwoniella europaea PYCC6329]|uniref:Uncharacterized protein n=1 Tax=Kwoniella europaea PYCC6329 TaxID=1423913 RepID=A0AAX4KVE4_9TREE
MSNPSYPNGTDRQSGASGSYRSAHESSQCSWYSTQQYPQLGAQRSQGQYHQYGANQGNYGYAASGNYDGSAQDPSGTASGNGQPNSGLSTEHKKLKFYAESIVSSYSEAGETNLSVEEIARQILTGGLEWNGDEKEVEEMNEVANKLILPIAFQRSPTQDDIDQIVRDTFRSDFNQSSTYRTRPSNPIYCEPPPPAWGRPHPATTRWDKDHI